MLIQIKAMGQDDFPCGTHIDWDWTDPNAYDYAYITGSVGQIKLSSPFHTESSTSSDISYIISSKDYLPEQGWMLLDKVFGCPNQYAQTPFPYFLLYNKYLGKIRLFAFNNTNHQHQKAVVTVSFSDLFEKTGLLTLQNTYPKTLDQYYPSVLISDKGVNYVEDYFSSAWLTTDFIMSFDYMTDNSKEYKLEFEVFSSVVSDVNYNGEFRFTTQTFTGEQEFNTDHPLSYLGDVASFLGTVPTNKELKKHLDKINDGVKGWGNENEHTNKFKAAVYTANNSLQNGDFKKFLLGTASAAAGVAGGLNVITGIVDMFWSKSNSNASELVEVMPTISHGSIELSGTIETETNATKYSLQLPGGNHERSDGSLIHNGLPVYDCPLGVWGLERQPKVDMFSNLKKTYINKKNYSNAFWNNQLNMYYKISDDINIAFNESSNLEILSIKAQLVAKPMYDIHPSHLNQTYDNHLFLKSFFGRNETGYGVEPYEALDAGVFTLIGSSSNVNSNPDFSPVYATPFINLENFKGTTIGFPYRVGNDYFFDYNKAGGYATQDVTSHCKLFLKIQLIGKPLDTDADQTPVVQVATYELNDFNYIYSHKEPEYTIDQQVNKTIHYNVNVNSSNATQDHKGEISTSGAIDLNTLTKDVVYTSNHVIELNAGIDITASNSNTFEAKVNFAPYGSNALVLNKYFTDCNPHAYAENLVSSISSRQYNSNNNNFNDEFSLRAFPNPANENIQIQVGNRGNEKVGLEKHVIKTHH